MPGWRIGFCAGNEKLIGALKEIKSYLDSGVFQPLQIAAVKVLESAQGPGAEYLREAVAVYQARRDVLVEGLRRLDWEVVKPKATVFVWARLPKELRKEGSLAFGRRLLERGSIAVCPGIGFDVQADDFVRFALVEPEKKLRIALERLASVL
jgi:alanine-synthesizing transaminase